MQSQSPCLSAFRELDHRANDGIDVRLLWRPTDDRLRVAVTDSKRGDDFTLEAGPRERPLDVFHHPYAYAGRGDVHAKRRIRERAWDAR
jgi:hypothetical protein